MSSLTETATTPMTTRVAIRSNPQEQPMTYLQHAPNIVSVSAATAKPKMLFPSAFIPFALFGGISLVVLLIAVICDEQGVWF
jgi:hypothetical protein